MRHIIAICFGCLVSIHIGMISVPGSWTIKVLPISNNNVDRIIFVDDLFGWACQCFPGVMSTDDGGNSWVKLDSNMLSERISSVWFINRQIGWAIGNSTAEESAVPVILTTNDGGRSWIPQKRLKARWQLQDIFFLDEKHGWAVGGGDHSGLILLTRDGGLSWDIQLHKFDRLWLSQVRFADVQHGWAVGQYGVLHTENGGRTWSSQGFRNNPFINGLCVLDRDNAWVVGGPGGIYRTTDAGSTWSMIEIPSDSVGTYLWDIAFADALKGWVCGDNGVIFSTQDGGRTWAREASFIDDFLWDIAITMSRVFIGAQHGRFLVRSR